MSLIDIFPKITEVQANNIRDRLITTEGWSELTEAFPKFDDAIAALPDFEMLRLCNVLLQEIVLDAIKDEIGR